MSSKLQSDVCCRLQVAPSGESTEVTAGLAESNGSLLPGLWCDPLHVTCGLTACTPGSASGPTLGNEYGKTLPVYLFKTRWGFGMAVASAGPYANNLHLMIGTGKVFPYSLPSVGPGADPGVQAVSPQVT